MINKSSKEGDSGYDDQSGSGLGIEITDPQLLSFLKGDPTSLLPALYG